MVNIAPYIRSGTGKSPSFLTGLWDVFPSFGRGVLFFPSASSVTTPPTCALPASSTLTVTEEIMLLLSLIDCHTYLHSDLIPEAYHDKFQSPISDQEHLKFWLIYSSPKICQIF